MSKNKTIKINVDESHHNFERTRVKPTQLFDLEDLEDFEFNELNKLPTKDLRYKLQYELLSEDEKEIITKILANRYDE